MVRDLNNFANICETRSDLHSLLILNGAPSPLADALAEHSSGRLRERGPYLLMRSRSAFALMASRFQYSVFKTCNSLDFTLSRGGGAESPYERHLQPNFWRKVAKHIEDEPSPELKFANAAGIAAELQCEIPEDIADDAIDEILECRNTVQIAEEGEKAAPDKAVVAETGEDQSDETEGDPSNLSEDEKKELAGKLAYEMRSTAPQSEWPKCRAAVKDSGYGDYSERTLRRYAMVYAESICRTLPDGKKGQRSAANR